VPFEDIVFDTFDGGSIPVSAASDEQELRLRDAIVPIDEPRYVDASNVARVLQRADPVIGYATPGDDAYAYPHRFCSFTRSSTTPWEAKRSLCRVCTLCNSGVVYDRGLPDGTELTFGNTSASMRTTW
jgi:hypothetical protein